jgi:hypothetical protein
MDACLPYAFLLVSLGALVIVYRVFIASEKPAWLDWEHDAQKRPKNGEVVEVQITRLGWFRRTIVIRASLEFFPDTEEMLWVEALPNAKNDPSKVHALLNTKWRKITNDQPPQKLPYYS